MTTISDALAGRTYKGANEFEPPITEKLGITPKEGPRKRKGLPREKIAELAELRRSDPTTWTYTALANKLRAETDKLYRCVNVAFVLRKFDPTLAQLDDPHQSKRKIPNRIPRTYHKTCVICEEPFAAKMQRSEVCYAAACRKVIISEKNRSQAKRRAAALSPSLEV